MGKFVMWENTPELAEHEAEEVSDTAETIPGLIPKNVNSGKANKVMIVIFFNRDEERHPSPTQFHPADCAGPTRFASFQDRKWSMMLAAFSKWVQPNAPRRW